MPFISVTRLRVRSVRFLPLFAVGTWRSVAQIRRTPGFLAGQLAIGRRRTYWTVTMWESQSAMQAYRNSPERTCVCCAPCWRGLTKAAAVHWEQSDGTMPSLSEVVERLSREGRLSKLLYPSPAHANGQAWPDRQIPAGGLRLRPLVRTTG